MANAPNPNPDTPARSTQPEPIELRRSLQLVMLAWVFGAAWMFTTTGAALTQYAKLLQMPPFGFGLLAALPFLGALAQLPTSFLIERYGHRKGLFLVSGIIHRLLWVAIALIPWMTPDAWWWPALLTLMLLSSLGGHVVAPTWISWMADLVPARIRGRYFSRRLQAGQLVGACVTLLIGTVLDRAQAAGAHTLMQTVSAALALAGVVGAVDFICFLPVPDPGHIRPDPRVSFWDLLRRPLADRNFRRFLGFNATVTFSLGYIGQFVWLYLFDVVGLSNMQANLMLMVAPLLALMIVYPIWGRLIDKLGRKPVLVIACLLVVHGGSSWVFVTREHWVLGYAAVMLAIAAWPGIELASFNIVLGMSTSHGGRRQGSAYVAISSLVTALAGVLSGLFAGAVAEWLHDWRGSFLGWPLTYHGVLFLFTALLRLAALAWLIRLEDSRAYSTREAFQYLGTNLYSNLEEAVFIPIRFLQRMGRWTYRVDRPRKP